MCLTVGFYSQNKHGNRTFGTWDHVAPASCYSSVCLSVSLYVCIFVSFFSVSVFCRPFPSITHTPQTHSICTWVFPWSLLAGAKAVSRWVCEIRWAKRFIPLFSPNCFSLHKIQSYKLLIFTKRRKMSGSWELWCYVLNEFFTEKEEEENNNSYSSLWAVGQKWGLGSGIGKAGVHLSLGESMHWSLGWLPWLPLKPRIRFNMLVLTFKSFQISRGRICFLFLYLIYV